ncbi:hypothetical protein BDY24DRAFT_443186 [Mrakia frigida]|uniref:uncharacterized protein n=1 Tax=Mrakia frigida TaxID=29902 RepID=UPI003FCBF954
MVKVPAYDFWKLEIPDVPVVGRRCSSSSTGAVRLFSGGVTEESTAQVPPTESSIEPLRRSMRQCTAPKNREEVVLFSSNHPPPKANVPKKKRVVSLYSFRGCSADGLEPSLYCDCHCPCSFKPPTVVVPPDLFPTAPIQEELWDLRDAQCIPETKEAPLILPCQRSLDGTGPTRAGMLDSDGGESLEPQLNLSEADLQPRWFQDGSEYLGGLVEHIMELPQSPV